MIPSMDMKKDELIALAEKLGLNPSTNQNKSELIDLINSAKGKSDPSPKPEKQELPKGDKNEALKKHPKFDKFNKKEKSSHD